jgi:hypothetical protein
LILATPADAAKPHKIANLSAALSQLTELTDQALDQGPITTRPCRDVRTSAVAGRGSSASILDSACRKVDGQVT